MTLIVTPREPTPDVCVILPAFNEALTIETCLRELQQVLPGVPFLVVDNASRDGTGDIARAAGATVIREERPGKGFAVTTGVQWALRQGYGWVALHDADNEYAARDLALLIAESQRVGAAGTGMPVMGVGLREVSLGKVLWRSLLANWVARKALELACRRPAPRDILTGARVFNAACARMLFAQNGLNAPMRGFELETALTRRAMRSQVLVATAPVRYTPRAAHQKKISGWDMLPILKAAWCA